MSPKGGVGKGSNPKSGGRGSPAGRGAPADRTGKK